MASVNADKAMLATANKDPVWSYKFRVLHAEIVVASDPNVALELLKVSPPKELESGEFAARRKAAQGLACAITGDYNTASAHLAEAALPDPGNLEVMANIAMYRAYLAQRQQDSPTAEAQYMRAIDLAHQKMLIDLEANARIRLGLMQMSREVYDSAINQFGLALHLAHAANAIAFEQVALGSVGWSYVQTGEFDIAGPNLAKAEAIAEQIHDVTNQEQWLRDLGILSFLQGDYSKAETYYDRSLALAQQLEKPATLSSNYHNFAQLELKRGHLEKAENYNKLSYDVQSRAPDEKAYTYFLLTSGEIARERGDFKQAERLLSGVVRSQKSDISLRWQAESDLANLYAARRQNAHAEAMFDAALNTVQSARIAVKQEDRRMSILDAWPFYDDYIRFLVNSGQEAKALQIAEFSRGRTLAEAFGIGGQQNASGLDPSSLKNFVRRRNENIFAYWISSGESYLWFVGPNQFKLFRLPARETIEAAVDAYNNEIREREDTGPSARGQALYQMLIGPAAAMVPPHSKVMIVPNRGLYKLNFEALVVPGEKSHFWIEDMVLESSSSIALLVKNTPRSTTGLKKLLVMGAPVQESNEFHALKFAPEEIASVAHHFSDGEKTVLTGQQATPSAYASARPGDYRYIHLVTHGTSNESRPLDSAVILSSDPDKSFKLYARDIKDIGPLRADLVTISSCYGAGEKAYSGEGLVGLAWAFMRAGSHQVVAALWEVGDATMPRLMDKFYAEIEHGSSVPEALRAAKLSILQSEDFHKKPYYWASLQLYTGP